MKIIISYLSHKNIWNCQIVNCQIVSISAIPSMIIFPAWPPPSSCRKLVVKLNLSLHPEPNIIPPNVGSTTFEFSQNIQNFPNGWIFQKFAEAFKCHTYDTLDCTNIVLVIFQIKMILMLKQFLLNSLFLIIHLWQAALWLVG